MIINIPYYLDTSDSQSPNSAPILAKYASEIEGNFYTIQNNSNLLAMLFIQDIIHQSGFTSSKVS
jgi:hypothetical protein